MFLSCLFLSQTLCYYDVGLLGYPGTHDALRHGIIGVHSRQEKIKATSPTGSLLSNAAGGGEIPAHDVPCHDFIGVHSR